MNGLSRPLTLLAIACASLAAAPGVDSAPPGGEPEGAAAKTLVMALDSDCVFCQQSMPFYRSLLEADRTDTQIVVATSPDDSAIIDYLSTERVDPDTVAFVEPGTLPVPGTPTLLLVDDQGLITHAWVGLLDDYREAEVISSIFG